MVCITQGARDQQLGASRELQHRFVREGVRADNIQQHDGGARARAAAAQAAVRRPRLLARRTSNTFISVFS